MKNRAVTLLLCLMLLCGCARADWADDTADALCARMTALAGERGIDVQMDVIRSGGTDAGSIYTTKMGVLLSLIHI